MRLTLMRRPADVTLASMVHAATLELPALLFIQKAGHQVQADASVAPATVPARASSAGRQQHSSHAAHQTCQQDMG